ncbi:MAG TPA: CRISPR system precrRNA processing endoribonuclease RAMP protein Cas6 [Anaerolineae bacterium]|nr:CRISPR system precrRNA processing endoribonuclease RAMP protein Cas6 [Anaerolineae bacterium]
MHYITYKFTPLYDPLHGRHITASGLHGLLFNIARQTDPKEATWLHKHKSPRPFSLVPLYDQDGYLAGMRVASITDRTTTLLHRSGEWFATEGRNCHLGGREFIIDSCRLSPAPNWSQLALTQPAKEVGLNFISPTSFRQGPGNLPLPLPRNVFASPARIWQTFAPPMLANIDNWLDWCEKDIFIQEHNIHTVTMAGNKHRSFTGFVGEVWYKAYKGDEQQLAIWQALANLATFCGIGQRTTMGMGAVERI